MMQFMMKREAVQETTTEKAAARTEAAVQHAAVAAGTQKAAEGTKAEAGEDAAYKAHMKKMIQAATDLAKKKDREQASATGRISGHTADYNVAAAVNEFNAAVADAMKKHGYHDHH